MVCSAYAANAVSVTEFTLAEVIFSLKRGWYFMRTVRNDHAYPPRVGVPGAYGSTVGLVSLGMIGRMMAERLQQLDVQVIAYDPFASADDAAALGVELTSLEESLPAFGCGFPAHALAARDGRLDHRRALCRHEAKQHFHQHGTRRSGTRAGDDRRTGPAP